MTLETMYKPTRDNPVTCERYSGQVRATVAGTVVAETHDALLVRELGHEPVWYFPPGDVNRNALSPTDHSTHCPRKGDASYWTIAANGKTLENAAWSYEAPFTQVTALKGYFSFYTDRVTLEPEARAATNAD